MAWGDQTGQGCFPQPGVCDRAAVGRDAQLSDLLSAASSFLEAPEIFSISWRDPTQTTYVTSFPWAVSLKTSEVFDDLN